MNVPSPEHLRELTEMGRRLDAALSEVGGLLITIDGRPAGPPLLPSPGEWAAVAGFEDEQGRPNFWQQALELPDGPVGVCFLRTKGLAGAGGGRLMHVPQATVLRILRGALLWTVPGEPPRRVEAPASISTPAGAAHRWLMLEETQCLVEFNPPF